MMDIKKHSKQKMDQIDIIFHCFNFTVDSNVCLAYQFVSKNRKKYKYVPVHQPIWL